MSVKQKSNRDVNQTWHLTPEGELDWDELLCRQDAWGNVPELELLEPVTYDPTPDWGPGALAYFRSVEADRLDHEEELAEKRVDKFCIS